MKRRGPPTNKQISASPISAENCNDYFSNIEPKINKTFPGDPILHWSLPESIYTFKLRPMGVNEVDSYISKLSTESKEDVLIKDESHALLTSLTSLFNKSILNHHLPADWKCSRVTPIFKGTGSINEPCNYRPSSVMSHISIFLEKCINSQKCCWIRPTLKIMSYLPVTNLPLVNTTPLCIP